MPVQVVSQCCAEAGADPRSALEMLVSRVKEGQLSEGALLGLLRAIQHKNPSDFPSPLLLLLGEVQRDSQQPEGTGGKEPFVTKSPCSAVDVYIFFSYNLSR